MVLLIWNNYLIILYLLINDSSMYLDKKCFKIVNILIVGNFDFNYFEEYVKNVNNPSYNIEYIVIIIGEINDKYKQILNKIQNKYKIYISVVSKNDKLLNIYKIGECNCCNYIIILDKTNRIRFANYNINDKTLIFILNKEKVRNINE